MGTSESDPSSLPISYDNSNVCQYIRLLKEHILSPLESGELAKHCFAAAMMAFAAIDGLGELLHPDPKAKAGVRFKWFLKRLGKNYDSQGKHLWKLRNSLDHSAINTFCFMSQAADAYGEHLVYWKGHFFVHTRQLTDDLAKAIASVEKELRSDAKLFQLANSKLTQCCISPSGWRNQKVPATAPADVWFLKYTQPRR